MPITPFDDSPVLIVPILKPRKSTKAFDRFRQGSSLTKNPALQRGISEFTATNEIVFGQAIKGEFSPAFNGAQAANNLSYEAIKSFNGAMEPFTIRYVTEFNPIFGRLVIHSIKANLCDGNFKLFNGTDRVQQFVPLRTKLPPNSSIPFNDMPSVYLLRIVNNPTLSNSVILSKPQPVNNGHGVVSPFDETAHTHNVTLTDSMSNEMKSALLQMHPSSSTLLPINHISATAGFAYDHVSPWLKGTDSLAYGHSY